MDKLLKRLDYHINKYNNSKYPEEERLNFLLSLDYKYFINYDNTTIVKMLYGVDTNNDYKLIVSCMNDIENVFNQITDSDYETYLDMIDFFKEKYENNESNNLFIFEADNNERVNKFNSLDYPSNVKVLIRRITKNNGKMNFDLYNLFVSFFTNESKINLMQILEDIFVLRIVRKDPNIFSENDIIEVRNEIDKTIKWIKNKTNIFIKESNKFNKNKSNKLKVLNEIKESFVNNKFVNVDIIKDFKDKTLIAYLIMYNTKLFNKDYLRELNITDNSSISKIDKLLNKYNVKISSNDISINLKELENKLLIIDKYFKEAKEYRNILNILINKINYKDLDNLSKYINKDIDFVFVLNNIEKIYKDDNLNNLFKNINLLKKYNINIINVIKYDEEIMFNDYSLLKEYLNIYIKYGIVLSNECYNYEFLKYDYSYIIDKFIEIGEYKLIRNNPSLINDKSIDIIKRCSLYKELGNCCLNEHNKIKGILRREESFIVDNISLNEIVIENYEELINKDILVILNNNKNKYDLVDLSILDNYMLDDLVYTIDGMYISKNKLINNMNKLLNSNLKEVYSYNELLYYSIIYNYPKLITLNNIYTLKNILNIKTKKLVM